MRTPAPLLQSRADVYALELRLESKVVLLYLLDAPTRAVSRSELARALGMKEHAVEVGLVALQTRAPVLVARTGPDGSVHGPRAGYIPADAPVRAAWGTSTAPQVREQAPGLGAFDASSSASLDEITSSMAPEAQEAGANEYQRIRSSGGDSRKALLAGVAVAAYTHARLRGDKKPDARKVAEEAQLRAAEALDVEAEAARAPPSGISGPAADIDSVEGAPVGEPPYVSGEDAVMPVAGPAECGCGAHWTKGPGAWTCPSCGPTPDHPAVLTRSPSVSDDAAWGMIEDGLAVVMLDAPDVAPPPPVVEEQPRAVGGQFVKKKKKDAALPATE